MALKILFTSDFHADEELKEAAIDEANSGDYDIFINLGDYMDMEYAEDLMSRIEIPAIGCTGNRDMMFDAKFLEDDSTPIYNFLDADIDGGEYKIILIGGDFPENLKQQIAQTLENYEGDSSKVVIGSHYPPQKLNDKIHSGKRIGFDEFREIIMKHKPAAWVSGHVHEDFGEDSLMQTVALNAAADETGKAWSLTLGDEGGVESYEEVVLKD